MGRKPIALIAFALVLGLVALARADSTVLHPGSRCVAVSPVGGAEVDISIEVVSAIVLVSDLADANAESELLRRCSAALSDCRAKQEPTPGWLIAGKWATIGIAIGGAFVLGLML